MKQDLKSFEKFMLSQGKWTLTSKTKEMLTYEHIQEAKKGSCLVALILFFFFIIPAILYLYFSSKPEKKQRFTISIDDEGDLSITGDQEGKQLFQAFQKQFEVNTSTPLPKSSTQGKGIDTTPFYKKWWGIILLIIFWQFAIQAIAIHYIWNETDWENQQKRLAIGGIVVVTLFSFVMWEINK